MALEQLAPASADTTPTGAVYPPGRGTGFLAELDLAYARVAGESGIAAGARLGERGVGEVVVRDFGRLLTGAAARPEGAGPLPRFGTALLTGISQSAWFVTTFVAEGFNVDPGTGGGVYAAALAVSGTGNWLAINQLAGEEEQRPTCSRTGAARLRADPHPVRRATRATSTSPPTPTTTGSGRASPRTPTWSPTSAATTGRPRTRAPPTRTPWSSAARLQRRGRGAAEPDRP